MTNFEDGNYDYYNPFDMSLNNQDIVGKERTKAIHEKMTNGVLFETDRLVLRELRPEDRWDIYEGLSDEKVVNSLKLTEAVSEEEDAERIAINKYTSVENADRYLAPMIERYKDGWGDYPTDYGIVDKQTGKVLGVIGITLESGTGFGSVEADYWLNSSAWHNGYMTEALKGMIGFIAENGLARRIGASHNIANKASGRVMRAAGMQLQGELLGTHSNDNYGVVNEAFLVMILPIAECTKITAKSELDLLKEERKLLNNTAAQMAYDIEIGFNDGLSYEERARSNLQARQACDFREWQIKNGIGEPVYI